MTKEQIYDAQISPLMAQILAICKEHKLAMLASFELDGDPDEGFLRCTSALLAEEYQPSDDILAAFSYLDPASSGPRQMMKLTTKNAQGQTTAVAIIAPR